MKKVVLLILAISSIAMLSQPARAQDQVGFTLTDFGVPQAGENVHVRFHWVFGNQGFWDDWQVPDEQGGGDYAWNVPDPEQGWVVDRWEAALPTTLPQPYSPASYNVVMWRDLMPDWFEWVIRPEI